MQDAGEFDRRPGERPRGLSLRWRPGRQRSWLRCPGPAVHRPLAQEWQGMPPVAATAPTRRASFLRWSFLEGLRSSRFLSVSYFCEDGVPRIDRALLACIQFAADALDI